MKKKIEPPVKEEPQHPTSRTCEICGETVDLTNLQNTMFHYHLPPEEPKEKKNMEVLPKDTNEYLVDVKIFEPYLVSACPYEIPMVRGLYSGASDGATFNTGYFTLRIFMTAKIFDEFQDWVMTQGWIKLIGITTISES